MEGLRHTTTQDHHVRCHKRVRQGALKVTNKPGLAATHSIQRYRTLGGRQRAAVSPAVNVAQVVKERDNGVRRAKTSYKNIRTNTRSSPYIHQNIQISQQQSLLVHVQKKNVVYWIRNCRLKGHKLYSKIIKSSWDGKAARNKVTSEYLGVGLHDFI